MNNVLLQRFTKNKIVEQPKSLINNEKNAIDEIPKDTSPVVSPEKLREELLNKVNPQPKIIMNQESLDTVPKIELVHFLNIFDFVDWYINNKNKFSEKQTKPLDTLIEARDMSIGGCNCNLEHRRRLVDDYFRNFWINNQKTDLLPTIQGIMKTGKIIFGDFLSYP